MSSRVRVSLCGGLIVAAFVASWLVQPSDALAGANNFRSAVGGISIDADGVLQPASISIRNDWRERVKDEVGPAPPQLNQPVGLRMISLRGIEEALQAHLTEDFGQLPDEIRFLAGIQRLQYIFVYPEQNDIVLAGPGEGWRVMDDGSVIGISTGRPVLHLEDLIVALRSARQARQGYGISCSIDPTADGRRRFDQYQRSLRTIGDFSRSRAEQAMGQQQITITGLPQGSRLARILVAADYRMKQYAMNLQEAPVRGLPSFLDLIQQRGRRVENTMPRWWLACNYEPLARSEDGLCWELRGQGVKALTEEDFVSSDGSVAGTGRTSPIAQQWAEVLTDKFDELAGKDPVFGELRNIMDMCVIAALLEKEGLYSQAGLSVPLLTDRSVKLPLTGLNAPKTVATKCSVMKVGRAYVIAASGGVQIASWDVASKVQVDPQIYQYRSQAAARRAEQGWYWN